MFRYYVPVQEFQSTILMPPLQRLKYHMTLSKLNGCEDRQNQQNFFRNLSIIPVNILFETAFEKFSHFTEGFFL
jgi:hypothetical protein